MKIFDSLAVFSADEAQKRMIFLILLLVVHK